MDDLIRLPGLIDVHTHLRVPGGENKEDFTTGTAAAVAGGCTMILAMPNTAPPLSKLRPLQTTRDRAAAAIYCDVGLYAGASPFQLDQLPALAADTVALKIYLNETFGPLRVEDLASLRACFETWPRDKLIAMHAESPNVAVGIGLAAVYERPVHFCHISRRCEIELIAQAKAKGIPVTCEVTPHHLFLTEADAGRLGPFGHMRPELAPPDDQAALWDHIDTTIDCIATDHAPHTQAEKGASPPPPGVPGLETSLPLILTAVKAGRLSLERLVELMVANPRRIYNLPEQPDTYIEVDTATEYTINNETLQTKCGWTPFAGMTVSGWVKQVVLRGQPIYRADQPGHKGEFLTEPGIGRMIP